jgi:hypothetical protein
MSPAERPLGSATIRHAALLLITPDAVVACKSVSTAEEVTWWVKATHYEARWGPVRVPVVRGLPG